MTKPARLMAAVLLVLPNSRNFGNSCALDHFAAGCRAFWDSLGETRDDRVFQAFAHHLLLHGRNVVRELANKVGKAAQCFVRVELQLYRKLAPVIRPNVTKPVLTVDLHR